MSQYAKIVSTTWSDRRPATSCVAGTSGEYAFEFTHEFGCPMQGPTRDPDACTCYVSRIRLVTTPAGDVLPTTEPDLSTDVRFWHKEAQRSRRGLIALCLVFGVSTAVQIAAVVLSW